MALGAGFRNKDFIGQRQRFDQNSARQNSARLLTFISEISSLRSANNLQGLYRATQPRTDGNTSSQSNVRVPKEFDIFLSGCDEPGRGLHVLNRKRLEPHSNDRPRLEPLQKRLEDRVGILVNRGEKTKTFELVERQNGSEAFLRCWPPFDSCIASNFVHLRLERCALVEKRSEEAVEGKVLKPELFHPAVCA